MSNTKIKILPDNLASKIAAGEVVQRPESVVKELLENAIDAGAKNIELIIKRAGKSLIQVCDDGAGMSEEDVLLSIQKHATSKITSFEDLEAIKTLGFRGEALSSIAAVSQVEIKTETRDEEIGTLIKIEEQGTVEKQKGSFPKGTCVSVKNLFYNIPARRKFLKTDTTELKHIFDTFNRTALAHPEITFKLFNADNLIYDYRSGGLQQRIMQVFADNMLDALIPVEEKTEFMNVHGYIGKPAMLKKSKGEQYLFLNNRYVVNRQINHAVFSAFENILEKGDYPFFILFIEIDPKRVDVNIHPSKLEIKFEDEKSVYNFVLAVIRKSIGTHDLVPAMSFDDEGGEEKLSFNHFNRVTQNDFSDRPVRSKGNYTEQTVTDDEIELVFGNLTSDIKKDQDFSSDHSKGFSSPEKEISHQKISTEKRQEVAGETTFITQLHNKYILSQIKSGLMIIDQHVAHERILYEKALARFDTDMPFSQQLLFPLSVSLDAASFQLLKTLNEQLEKIGFEFKFFSDNTVVIEGVPEDIKSGSEERILRELIEEFMINEREKKLEQRDNIAKSYSCKTAIKAGDKLSDREMRQLIDQLFATSMPYVCPHGRPIVIKISLEEFDRRFGRT